MEGVNVHKLKMILFVILMQLVLASLACAGEAKSVATVTIPPAPGLYATEPQPLTVNQCGQCHPGVFAGISNNGAKHQFDCQKCHSTFHSYNPKKGGWEALMP